MDKKFKRPKPDKEVEKARTLNGGRFSMKDIEMNDCKTKTKKSGIKKARQ